jgi:hypothetical protein
MIMAFGIWTRQWTENMKQLRKSGKGRGSRFDRDKRPVSSVRPGKLKEIRPLAQNKSLL